MNTTHHQTVWQVFDGTDCLAVFRHQLDATEFRDHHLEQRRLDHQSRAATVEDDDVLTIRPAVLDR